MATCKFPLCKSFAQNNGYCVFHRQYANFSTPKEKSKEPPLKIVAPKKPINKVSVKQKASTIEYKKIVAEMFLSSKKCEIKSPVCTRTLQASNGQM